MKNLRSLRSAGILAMSAALLVLGSSIADATILNPGSTINLRSASEPEDGHLLAQTNFTFTSTAFTGTLTSKVWEDDKSNPWGGITFTYKLANTSDCTESLGLFALRGFSESLTDVNYSGSGIAPRTVSRSADASQITFGFFNRHGEETLLPGNTSAWLVIQTGCTSWGLNQLVGLDSMEIIAPTFTPTAAPEPTTAVMVVLGGLACLAGKSQRASRHG
jgi:hypothetical protein